MYSLYNKCIECIVFIINVYECLYNKCIGEINVGKCTLYNKCIGECIVFIINV